MSHQDDDDLDPRVENLNAEHAVATEGGRTHVLTERTDPITGRRVLDRSSPADFRLKYANQFVTEGRHDVPLGTWWLRHPSRRQYDQVAFAPGRDLPPQVYNLWRGWAIIPKPGDCQVVLDHLFEIAAAGDEATFVYLMDWLAFTVQYPAVPIESAIVWRGGQGIGKSIIGDVVMSQILGQHYMMMHSMAQVVGRFSGHLQDALLVLADEALWGGDKASEGALKTLITSPNLVIERKGKDIIWAANYVHLMIATNKDWAVPVDIDDRRFAIVDVPATRLGQRAYFDRIVHCATNGGRAAFLHTLLTREIAARPPDTPHSPAAQRAKLAQKLRTLGPLWIWWHETLDAGRFRRDAPWPTEVETTELVDHWLAYSQKRGLQRRALETEVGQFLGRLGVLVRRQRAGVDRLRFYALGELTDARTVFAHALKATPDQFGWGDDD